MCALLVINIDCPHQAHPHSELSICILNSVIDLLYFLSLPHETSFRFSRDCLMFRGGHKFECIVYYCIGSSLNKYFHLCTYINSSADDELKTIRSIHSLVFILLFFFFFFFWDVCCVCILVLFIDTQLCICTMNHKN